MENTAASENSKAPSGIHGHTNVSGGPPETAFGSSDPPGHCGPQLDTAPSSLFRRVPQINDRVHPARIPAHRPPRFAEGVLDPFCRDVHQPVRDVRVAFPHDLSHAAGPHAGRDGVGGERVWVRRFLRRTAGRLARGSSRPAQYDRARHVFVGRAFHAALRRDVAAGRDRLRRARGDGKRDVSPRDQRTAGGHRAGAAAGARLRGHPAGGECGLRVRRFHRRHPRELLAVLALRGRCADDGPLRLHRARVAAARPARADAPDAVERCAGAPAERPCLSRAVDRGVLRSAGFFAVRLHVFAAHHPPRAHARRARLASRAGERVRPAARLEWRAHRAGRTAADGRDDALRRAPGDGARPCPDGHRFRHERRLEHGLRAVDRDDGFHDRRDDRPADGGRLHRAARAGADARALHGRARAFLEWRQHPRPAARVPASRH